MPLPGPDRKVEFEMQGEHVLPVEKAAAFALVVDELLRLRQGGQSRAEGGADHPPPGAAEGWWTPPDLPRRIGHAREGR